MYNLLEATMNKLTLFLLTICFCCATIADDWQEMVTDATANVNDTVVDLRHHFHANPELGNREFNTAKKIAAHLRSLGFEDIQEGVSHTGVVAVLKGGKIGIITGLFDRKSEY
jgi:amidohydrolase